MSDEARFPLTRRSVIGAVSLIPLAALVPDLLAEAKAATPNARLHFFNAHQAAVVDAATRRIAPGPEDDPLEAGHPGAHEANVVRYIDTMLSLFTFNPPKLFTGGPFSDRNTKGPNQMAKFTPPDVAQASAWKKRINQLRAAYVAGIKLLDSEAGGDFTTLSRQSQDNLLAGGGAVGEFRSMLFQHTIEGMYSVPEYGGNANLVSWKEIGWPGDRHPKGFSDKEMSQKTPSVIDPSGVTALVLANFEEIAKAMGSHKIKVRRDA